MSKLEITAVYYVLFAMRGSTKRLVKIGTNFDTLKGMLEDVRKHYNSKDWVIAEILEQDKAFGVDFFTSTVFVGNGLKLEGVENIIKDKRT